LFICSLSITSRSTYIMIFIKYFLNINNYLTLSNDLNNVKVRVHWIHLNRNNVVQNAGNSCFDPVYIVNQICFATKIVLRHNMIYLCFIPREDRKHEFPVCCTTLLRYKCTQWTRTFIFTCELNFF